LVRVIRFGTDGHGDLHAYSITRVGIGTPLVDWLVGHHSGDFIDTQPNPLGILSIPNRTLWDPMAELLDQHPEMWLVQVLLPYQAWLCLGISISLIYLRWRAWFNSSSRQAVRIETAAA